MKNTFLTLLSSFLLLNLFSQKQIENKTFITSDKKAYITFLEENKFGYVSYNGESPYEHSLSKNHKTFCNNKIFEIKEKGFGIYEIKNNSIFLYFNSKMNPLDRIELKKSQPKRISDTINVAFNIETYSTEIIDNQVLGVRIKSENNSINLNSEFDNKVTVDLHINQIPIIFIINENTKVLVSEIYDYNFKLGFNQYKLFSTENIKNKIFKFSELTQIKN